MGKSHGIFDRAMAGNLAEIGSQEGGHVTRRRIDLAGAWPVESPSLFTRSGKRLIYLNAFPAPAPGSADAREAQVKAYVVCDGGVFLLGCRVRSGDEHVRSLTGTVWHNASN